MSEARKSDLVDIECHVIAETPAAWKIWDGVHKAVWVPKSQCEIEDSPSKGGLHALKIVTMPEWLATEKGLV